jgi:hypothetical protein
LNPVPAIDGLPGGVRLDAVRAVEAALAERPSDPLPSSDAAWSAGSWPGPGTLPAAGAAPAAVLADIGDNASLAAEAGALATVQATQGRATLGQLAETAAQRAAMDATTGGLATGAPQQPGPPPKDRPQARLADLLAVPVLLTPMHNAPAERTRLRAPHEDLDEQAARRRARRRDEHGRGQQRDEQAADDAVNQAPDEAAEPEALPEAAAPAAAPDTAADRDAAQDAPALRRRIAEQAPPEVRRELALGRRLLVVLHTPAHGRGAVPAEAWLLNAARTLRFAGRWWPGPRALAPWSVWRTFRDGDSLELRALRTRSSVPSDLPPLAVLLHARRERIADAEGATLELAERLRLAQALGNQWSVLVTAAPHA